MNLKEKINGRAMVGIISSLTTLAATLILFSVSGLNKASATNDVQDARLSSLEKQNEVILQKLDRIELKLTDYMIAGGERQYQRDRK